jgi:hypothetical protein
MAEMLTDLTIHRIGKKHMKISPEPLAPLRNWRELWQLEPLGYESIIREQTTVHLEVWNQSKRAGFSWLSHLLGRKAHR